MEFYHLAKDIWYRCDQVRVFQVDLHHRSCRNTQIPPRTTFIHRFFPPKVIECEPGFSKNEMQAPSLQIIFHAPFSLFVGMCHEIIYDWVLCLSKAEAFIIPNICSKNKLLLEEVVLVVLDSSSFKKEHLPSVNLVHKCPTSKLAPTRNVQSVNQRKRR